MDPRLLRYYNLELQHLRETGAEFAEQFPKVAARLGMHGLEVADPYVERLLEGVGFLAARVHLKLDAEFPRFTQALLEIVYPHYLAPTPSMLVAQLKPDLNDPNLGGGPKVPRGTMMTSVTSSDDATSCEFQTAQDVTLWPIEIVSATLFFVCPGPAAEHLAGRAAHSRRSAYPAEDDRRPQVQPGRDRSAVLLPDRPRRCGEQAVRAVPGVSARHARRGSHEGGDEIARVPAGVVGPSGRVQRRRGAVAGYAAIVSGLPAPAGILLLSPALSVRRGRWAGEGAETCRRRSGRADRPARTRRG